MKKGQYTIGHKWLYYTIALFLITAMVLFFRAQIQDGIISQVLCADPVEQEIAMNEALFSCLTYYDSDLERNIPGTVDMNKFNEDTIKECFKFLKQDIQIKLGDIIIGDTISNKVTHNHVVKVYNNGKITTQVIEFGFREQTC